MQHRFPAPAARDPDRTRLPRPAPPAYLARMSAPLNPALLGAVPSPIMESKSWVQAAGRKGDPGFLDLSQAVPAGAPSIEIRRAMAEAALSDDTSGHLYGDVLGRAPLRAAIADQWSALYGGAIHADQVGVTAGANQAYCAAIASLAGAGDEVILPSPWYFNHKMWLDMNGIHAIPLACNQDGLPDPTEAARLFTPRTRAIALVTPNNPTGVEYPDALLAELMALAHSRGAALILDETYRDYRSGEGAPHSLFQQPGWDDTLIHLYSFSKIMRLTGHRIGAMIASARRVAEIEKFLDTVTICPNQLGQIGALKGLETLEETAKAERAVFASRRKALIDAFAANPGGWRLLGSGAYFAYAEHPHDAPSPEICRKLVEKAGLLFLPGTFFGPTRAEGGDGFAERTCRIAFANVDEAGIAEMARRLSAFTP